MARLINQEKVRTNIINNYTETIANKYARYLDSTPTFCTYYSGDLTNSMSDEILQNTVEIVGAESPKKYAKIMSFTLYGINEMTPSLETGEFIEHNIEGEAIIIPNLIKPLPDDFFVISYMGAERLFKVNGVDINALQGKKFYKITFSYANEDFRLLEQQVSEEYVEYFENLGTNQRAIISRKSQNQPRFIH